jgi:hypothetical protein
MVTAGERSSVWDLLKPRAANTKRQRHSNNWRRPSALCLAKSRCVAKHHDLIPVSNASPSISYGSLGLVEATFAQKLSPTFRGAHGDPFSTLRK